MQLDKLDPAALAAQAKDLRARFEAVKARQLNLDLTRGKPSAEQLALSDALDGILDGNYIAAGGIDCRNYGGLLGLDECRALGGEIMGLAAERVMAGGNSSLTLMHQCMTAAHGFGLRGADSAWARGGAVKFLCPVPGYDRHFAICEQLGIEMLPVAMDAHGPDMDAVEALVAADASIKGIWCVPKYSNPSGVVYSDDTVRRLARLAQRAGPGFTIFWDNAYAIHDLSDNPPQLLNLYDECVVAGTEDSVLMFASTSKITHAGSGVAFVGASAANLAGLQKYLSILTIGPDKINQLRHVRFFAEPGSLAAHMRKHAELIKPRFAAVLEQLQAAFGDNDLGHWEAADGGYFISFDTRPGLAKKVVGLAAEAGVKLTPAGATHPYGRDPDDRNIRIAPTVPTVAQVHTAMEVFVLCVQLASAEQML